MNSLSWLFYAAEAVDKFAILALGSAAAGGAFAVFGLVEERRKWVVSGAIAFVCCFALFSLLPSKQTIMLIAASEVGEDVLATDAAKTIGGEAGTLATDSLKLLRKYVTEQLGNDTALSTITKE